MPTQSDTISTDRNGLPSRQNVDRCVHITVVVRGATRARPHPNIQRELFNHVPTTRTALAGRKPTVNLDQRATVPERFVLKLSDQLRPSSIADGLGERVVPDHVSHSQIFDGDQLVFLNESSRELVQMVGATISNPGVNSSNLQRNLSLIPRAFLLAIHPVLRLAKSGHIFAEVFWVHDLLARRQRDQARDAHVETDLPRCYRDFWNWRIEQQTGKPPPSSIKVDRDCRGGNPFGQFSRPDDIQGFLEFCKKQFSIAVLEGARGEFRTTAVPFAFEFWITRPLRPEIPECLLQVSQGLLHGNARDFVQELEVILFFPGGQSGTRLLVADSFLAFVPAVRSQPQRLVVDQSDAPERPTQKRFLRRSRIKTVFVRPDSHVSQHSPKSVRHRFGACQPGTLRRYRAVCVPAARPRFIPRIYPWVSTELP